MRPSNPSTAETGESRGHAAPPEPDQPSRSEVVTPPMPVNILVVDDDPGSLNAMEAILAGPGRTIFKAESGHDALRYLLRHDFAVILLDVRMPQLDGFETAALIRDRERSRYTPIIFLSAVDTLEADVFRGLSSGAVDYLFKPVAPAVVQNKVSVFVDLFRLRERVKQQAVQQSEARYAELLRQAPEAIILLDTVGRLQYVNPAMERLTGYYPQELRGKHISECGLLTADSIPKAAQEFDLTTTGRERLPFEVEIICKDRSLIIGEAHPCLIREEGKVTGMLVSIRDITQRKRAEEALRESEAKLRLLVEGVRDYAIFMLDPEGRVTSWTTAAERLKGYHSDEILGRRFSCFYPPEDVAAGKPAHELRVAARDGRIEDEGWRVRKDGSRFWANQVITAILDDGGRLRGFVKITRDLTERKEAERALLESEERFRLLIREAPEAIILLDTIGRFQYINPATERLTGYTSQELLGTHFSEYGILTTASIPKALQEFELTMAEQERPPFEVEIIRKHDRNLIIGEIHPRLIHEEGRIAGMVVTIRDVTERKRAEESLRQSEEQFRRSVEEAPIPVIMQAEDGEVLQISKTWTFLTGYTLEDMRTFDAWLTRAYGFGADQIRNCVRQLFQGGTGMTETDFEIITRSGERRIWSFSASSPGILRDGRRFIVGTAVDITERKHMEDRLRRLNAELEERVAERTAELQGKNQELEAFSFSVSHDLRAPLRGIDGYSRLLLEEYADRLDGEGRFFLETIRKSTDQMSQLIDDLLAYSRIERREVQLGSLDLRALVEALVDQFRNDLQSRRIDLKIDIPFDSVCGEAEGLTQVVRNLLDNAIKFTAQVAAPRIEIAGRETEASWMLWVSDNGTGFDMKYHDRIFEIFQRLHHAEDYAGTGIGLAIVRKAMQRMGGRVWAESTPGAGATFYLEWAKP